MPTDAPSRKAEYARAEELLWRATKTGEVMVPLADMQAIVAALTREAEAQGGEAVASLLVRLDGLADMLDKRRYPNNATLVREAIAALTRPESTAGGGGEAVREVLQEAAELFRLALATPQGTRVTMHATRAKSLYIRLKETIAVLARKAPPAQSEYVRVPKAEFVRALESIQVPKMSPMKQELFKAGTHAVIRALNEVLAAATQEGSDG